jgi:hypothetical protein
MRNSAEIEILKKNDNNPEILEMKSSANQKLRGKDHQ